MNVQMENSKATQFMITMKVILLSILVIILVIGMKSFKF